MKDKNSIIGKHHPKVDEAFNLMEKGRMSRREFVRIAALLGVSAGTAYAVAGIPIPSIAQTADNLPFPADDPNAKSGGILKCAMQVQKMEDPATYSWVEMSNQTRHLLEHLTLTSPDNVTRPMLAERWEASDDLKTWTFYIRKGVKWSNGDDFTAHDVAFNVTRWCDPDLASSNTGLSSISGLLEESGDKKVLRDGAIEVVDDYTFRFHLSKPVLSVAEDLYNYPTALLHPSFKAPFSDNPIGTGPFELAELVVGEKCILKRRDGDYWGGTVYLDEIHYYNFDEENQLTIFSSGEVDAIYEFEVEQIELAKALDGNIVAAQTAQTLCCRFQTSRPPFDDIRVRQAIVKGVDNAAIKALVYPDGGNTAWNTHVSPIHPEYFALPDLKRDVEGAKALLAEAGYGDGLELTIDVGNTEGTHQQTICEAMRDQLKDIGVTLNINVLPSSKYWEIWDTTLFGATAWTHRPLGTMVLSLGYRSGVPWNETHYNNPEFDAALDNAESILDVEERRKAMEKVQKIIQDDAVMVQPLFRPVFTMVGKSVQNYPPHPTQYHQFNKVWKS